MESHGKKWFALVVLSLSVTGLFAVFHPKKNDPPNVLLITVDALRYDHLSCYGYGRDTSPNIDQLAGEGLLFTQAIAQSSSTVASVVSLLTSSYPHINNVDDFGEAFPRGFASLPGILRAKGYVTACITSCGGFDGIKKLDKEFGFFYNIDTYLMSDKLRKVVEITDKVTELIEENKHKRFFFWAHFIDTHRPPLNPPMPYHDMFLNDKYAGLKEDIPISNDPMSGIKGLPRLMVGFNKNVVDLNYYISVYDGAIRYVDEQIALILKQLEKANLAGKTIVIVSSDHGEGLGEHGLYFTHGLNLHDELIRIPLIIKYDKFDRKRKTIDRQVQSMDIAPTILDILGIARPASMAGESLLPFFDDRGRENKNAFSSLKNSYCIRTPGWKLIYDEETGLPELYNLSEDPGELNNLASLPQARGVFVKLKRELDNHIKRGKRYKRAEKETLSEDLKIKLKGLGYLQ